MGKKNHTVDMTKGSILSQIISLVAPLIVTGLLQTLYNTADVVVVGKFAGKNALAAVGSTGPAINLIVALMIGLSSASSVVIAQKLGANNRQGVFKSVHTSVALSIIGGIFLAIVGFFIAKPLMQIMGSPKEVINLSSLYMKLYFIGIPFSLFYNFGSSILRAIGDTKRPMYLLMISGLINIFLNLIFVIVFKMSVAGVALATISAQLFCAVCVFFILIRTHECYRLIIKEIKIYKKELYEILYLGIPAGIQSSIFSISNVIVQSSVNSVGSVAMAGNAAASSIEGFVYITLNAFHYATLTFISQNYGARNYKRIIHGIVTSGVLVTIIGLSLGSIICMFPRFFVEFFSDSEKVIEIGIMRIRCIVMFYFLCGLMEIAVAGLRGLGSSVIPMLVSIFGVCGIRLIIVLTGGPYRYVNDLKTLFYSYPISWAVTACIHFIMFSYVLKRRRKYEKNSCGDYSPR